MQVVKNKTDYAKEIEEAIINNGGYCCCAFEKLPEFKCMCEDFRNKIEDPNFEGDCHCGLFTKSI